MSSTTPTRPRKVERMPKPGDVRLEVLPPQLRLLVRAIGEEAAFKLVSARGGTVLHVPSKVSEDHPLCDLLGGYAYGQLVREYGGMRIELTKADALIRQVRHMHVQAMAESGATLNEIALHTQYSRRHVINLLADLRQQAPEQGDLFAAPPPAAEAAEPAPELGPYRQLAR